MSRQCVDFGQDAGGTQLKFGQGFSKDTGHWAQTLKPKKCLFVQSEVNSLG